MSCHRDPDDDNEYLVVTDDDRKRLGLGTEAEVIQRCYISGCRAQIMNQDVPLHMSQLYVLDCRKL